MSNPIPSRLIAGRIDPTTRDFIDARLHEEIKVIRDDIRELRVALLAVRESLQRDMGSVSGRMSNAEDLLSMSSKRLADLAKLAKQMDEET